MINGGCCGAVKFELLSQPSMMGTCHCSRCRKVDASTMAFVKKEDLKWLRGKEQVQLFQPTLPYLYSRCFCKICGISLGEILSELDSFPIAANVLDGKLGVTNSLHEFVNEKPSWYEICDDAGRSEGYP